MSSDLVKLMREHAEQAHEAGSLGWRDSLNDGADEIERMRSKYEPDDAPDAAQTISHLDEQIAEQASEIDRLRAETDVHKREVSRARQQVYDLTDEVERLRARVKELEGQHKGLVLNNAILRQRPDLPLNRIPAARAMTKLYEENARLRALLEEWDDAVVINLLMEGPRFNGMRWTRAAKAWEKTRAALEGK